ncbi:ATP-binding protein [Rothia sp. LK2588]|uniref:ATP-binding protein n=1 Tax=Rothia sp. LK2588 TaxID=3114369 RepID=UPI0034CE7FAF
MNAQPVIENPSAVAPELVGRSAHLGAFMSRFETSSWGAPIVVSGATGMGKTTLLRAFEAVAREAGWRVISETPVKGLTERMSGTYLPALYENLAESESGLFEKLPLAEQITTIAEKLQATERGLLITIDRYEKFATSSVRELLTACRAAAERRLPVLVVISGRVGEVREFAQPENGEEQGAEHLPVCTLTRPQTEHALKGAIQQRHGEGSDGGEDYLRSVCELTCEQLASATQATAGYPYMIGLVAERIAESLMHHASREYLPYECFERALNAAHESLGLRVLDPLLEQMSAGDRAFVEAMAQDDGPSKMSDIATRLQKNAQYVGVYRNRLVESQIIRPASYGKVTFAIEHLREHLRTAVSFGADNEF